MPAGEVNGLQLLGQRGDGAGFNPLEDSGPRQDLVHVAPLAIQMTTVVTAVPGRLPGSPRKRGTSTYPPARGRVRQS